MLPMHITANGLDHIRPLGDNTFHSNDRGDLHNPCGIQNHPLRLATIECCENHPSNQFVHDDSDIDTYDCRCDEEKSLPNDAMGCAWNNDCHRPARIGYLYGGCVLHRWIRCHRSTMARIWITMCRNSNFLLVCRLQRILHSFRGKLKRTLQQTAISSLIQQCTLVFLIFF